MYSFVNATDSLMEGGYVFTARGLGTTLRARMAEVKYRDATVGYLHFAAEAELYAVLNAYYRDYFNQVTNPLWGQGDF